MKIPLFTTSPIAKIPYFMISVIRDEMASDIMKGELKTHLVILQRGSHGGAF
jgi:hypothetical protein